MDIKLKILIVLLHCLSERKIKLLKNLLLNRSKVKFKWLIFQREMQKRQAMLFRLCLKHILEESLLKEWLKDQSKR